MASNPKMTSPVRIYSYVRFAEIDPGYIPMITGQLLKNVGLVPKGGRTYHAEIVDEAQILLNERPEATVCKLGKEPHIRAFLEHGTLQLGTFDYYNAYDHEEIGDAAEGKFVLAVHVPPSLTAVAAGGGYDHYVLCCYAGGGDQQCARRFAYDASFKIRDISGFASAVGRRLGAVSFCYASCAYGRDKVIVSRSFPEFDLRTVSGRLLTLVNEAKYFVKPALYAHQQEFRILWQMPEPLKGPAVLDFPEAVSYCEGCV